MLSSSSVVLGRMQRPFINKTTAISSDGRIKGLGQQCTALKLGMHKKQNLKRRQHIAQASADGGDSPSKANSQSPPTPQELASSIPSTQEIASTASRPEDDQAFVDAQAQLEREAAVAMQQAVEEEAFEAAAVASRQNAPAQPSVAVPEEVQSMSTAELAKEFLVTNPVAKLVVYGAGAFFGITFIIAVVRVGLKNFSPQAKRKKTVNKNKVVIDALSQYLPANRAGLTGATMTTIRLRTGFTPVEIFRKYLWYLLRERKFDNDAVEDVLALRTALGLSEEQVAEALKERAQRIYDKYGNVMLETEGMTQAGIERKATARALFSKMLYMVEKEELVTPAAAETVNLRDIFGATEDDVARLRIASLYDVDLDAAIGLPDAPESEDA